MEGIVITCRPCRKTSTLLVRVCCRGVEIFNARQVEEYFLKEIPTHPLKLVKLSSGKCATRLHKR